MSLLDRPTQRRKIAFMLTPLVDVMFLLLIFFMLSSQTAPYSLLTISVPDTGAPAAPAAPTAPAAASAARPRQVLVSIFHDYVRYDGTRTALGDLKAAINQSKAAGLSSAVVLTTSSATVQDVVSVIEAFDTTDFGDMRLIMQQGSAP